VASFNGLLLQHVMFANKHIQRKTTQSLKQSQLECGPMPNLMVALPIIGGALCSTPQSLADAHY